MELYIHIPFCIRKCTYCSFVSFSGCKAEQMENYVSSLIIEAEQRKAFVKDQLKTVYIGGGTPSLIPPEQVNRLLSALRDILSFSQVDEFTSEANPGTVTPEWLQSAFSCGVNRISFGMQAYQEHLLKTLGRIHRYEDVARSVKMSRAYGISNINLDLIFGIPGQTMKDWLDTLKAAVSLVPEHISAYGLIPEEGTPLFRALESGKLSLPDPDLEREMYDTAISFLSDAGYKQYEISNFAFPGYECRHNIGYWNQIPYLGLGVSAASMIMSDSPSQTYFSTRWTNPETLNLYNSMLEHLERFEALKETVSADEARFETVMLSLRMTKGMNRTRFRELHGNDPEFWYGDILTGLENHNLLVRSEDSWRLTRRGMDIQNSVLLEFMEQ